MCHETPRFIYVPRVVSVMWSVFSVGLPAMARSCPKTELKQVLCGVKTVLESSVFT